MENIFYIFIAVCLGIGILCYVMPTAVRFKNKNKNTPDNEDIIEEDEHDWLGWDYLDKCDDRLYMEELNLPIQINCAKVNDDIAARLPCKGTCFAAGFDLYAEHVVGPELSETGASAVLVELKPGECVIFGTNLKMEIPDGYYLDICSRSGLSIIQGLQVANSPARIDSDYRGEIKIGIRNTSNLTRTIALGTRIAQTTLHKIIPTEFGFVDELSETERGEKGLGSTNLM